MRVRRRLTAILALVAVAACSRERSAPPVAPGEGPRVVAVSPARDQQGVPTESPLWAEFDGPLDSATVNAGTVFLRVDTRRLPIRVRWDAATRRVWIEAVDGMLPRRTHTLELTAAIHGASGTPLGASFVSQFKTLAVRRPADPLPADGASGESPVVALSWRGAESFAGRVEYEVYAGADSSAVAARALAPFKRGPEPYALARSPWSLGSDTYWSVRATNLDNGDRLDGPTWRFATLAAGTPTASVTLFAREWGSKVPGDTTTRCSPTSRFLWSGFPWSAIRFDLTPYRGFKLAAARVELVLGAGRDSVPRGAELHAPADPWIACVVRQGFPALAVGEGPLATATLPRRDRLRYESTALASHLEAAPRPGMFDGWVVRSVPDLVYDGAASELTLTYYVPAATAPVSRRGAIAPSEKNQASRAVGSPVR